MKDEPVRLELSRSQAIVLLEWLSRSEEAGPTSDPAEQRVLWLIEGQLENALVEPLKPDYLKLVEAARRAVNEGG